MVVAGYIKPYETQTYLVALLEWLPLSTKSSSGGLTEK